MTKTFNAPLIIEEIRKSVLRHSGHRMNIESLAIIAGDVVNEKLTAMIKERIADFTVAELQEIVDSVTEMQNSYKKLEKNNKKSVN